MKKIVFTKVFSWRDIERIESKKIFRLITGEMKQDRMLLAKQLLDRICHEVLSAYYAKHNLIVPK
jgi:hypothetical protein